MVHGLLSFVFGQLRHAGRHRMAKCHENAGGLFRTRGRRSPLAPAEHAPVAAQPAAPDQLALIEQRRVTGQRVRLRGDEQRVRRAPRLAHEAGLAVLAPGDHREAVLAADEDVGRADADTDVAADASLRADELDHQAGIWTLTGGTGSRAVQTWSRPPTNLGSHCSGY